MLNKEWPAEDYATGSYIQSTVASPYLKNIDIKPHHKVLDIGCGDGGFSMKIIKKFPMASFTGMDASENMLSLARKITLNHPHAEFIIGDVMDMDYENQFDRIVSFWCLQWTSEVIIALKNIYHALKPGGKFYAVFPTGDDAFVESYETIKNSGEFPILDDFIPPGNSEQFKNIELKLRRLPFGTSQIRRDKQGLMLPSFDTFRKFIRGVSFFHGQIAPEQVNILQEAMVKAFEKKCQAQFKGKPYFEFTNFYLTATK